MNQQSRSKIPSWRVRLTAELRRDKKKTTILVGLVVVAGIVGGKVLVKQVATAAASETSVGSAIVVSDTDHSDTLSTDMTNHRAHDSNRGVPGYVPFTRDIFRLKWSLFSPQDAEGSVTMESTVAEHSTENQAKRRVIEQQAGTLQLEGVVSGAKPMAIINGQVVRVGRTYKGFHVISVAAHSCVVSKEGVRLVLQQQGWRTLVDDKTDVWQDIKSHSKSGKEQESD